MSLLKALFAGKRLLDVQDLAHDLSFKSVLSYHFLVESPHLPGVSLCSPSDQFVETMSDLCVLTDVEGQNAGVFSQLIPRPALGLLLPFIW